MEMAEVDGHHWKAVDEESDGELQGSSQCCSTLVFWGLRGLFFFLF